jgi:hypothetical protein
VDDQYLTILFSINEAKVDKLIVRTKYMAVIVIHISKTRYVEAISSIPWKVSSCMEIIETIEESFIVEMA